MSPDFEKASPGTVVAPGPTTERHLALLGGWRRTGTKPAPDRAFAVAVLGGVNLDYGQVAFPAGGTTITQVAWAGGIDITVPAGTRVEVRGFHLFGGEKVQVGEPSPDGPVVRIRSYSLFGGVHVHT